MIVLVEVHAMIGFGSGSSPTPIPYLAYVFSDEGSRSWSATEPPRPRRQKENLIWFHNSLVWLQVINVLYMFEERFLGCLGIEEC